MKTPLPAETLSPLESRVMEIIWRRQEATAEQVLEALGADMTNATVRTLLRRIESKGYLEHRVEGRAFVYYPSSPPMRLHLARSSGSSGGSTTVLWSNWYRDSWTGDSSIAAGSRRWPGALTRRAPGGGGDRRRRGVAGYGARRECPELCHRAGVAPEEPSDCRTLACDRDDGHYRVSRGTCGGDVRPRVLLVFYHPARATPIGLPQMSAESD